MAAPNHHCVWSAPRLGIGTEARLIGWIQLLWGYATSSPSCLGKSHQSDLSHMLLNVYKNAINTGQSRKESKAATFSKQPPVESLPLSGGPRQSLRNITGSCPHIRHIAHCLREVQTIVPFQSGDSPPSLQLQIPALLSEARVAAARERTLLLRISSFVQG